MALDQTYCVACGERRGGLPPRVAKLIGVFDMPTPPVIAGVPPMAASLSLADPLTGMSVALSDWLNNATYPSPRVIALAVMSLLAFGVMLGSVVGATTSVSPLYVMTPAAPVAAQAARLPASQSPQAEVQFAGEVVPTKAAPTEEVAALPPSAGSATKVNHVWLIVLSGQGYDRSFGDPQSQSYLASDLVGKGQVLENYFAVAQSELANSIALVSGQGPTSQILENCPAYSELKPGAVDLTSGQALGDGCSFPETVRTLPDVIAATGKSTYAYVEDIDNGANGRATACARPALGSPDPDHKTNATNSYASWSNPLAYFKSFIAGPNCAFQLGGLKNLESDLSAGRAPAFSLVVPNRCHSGSEVACAPGAPTGLASSDDFLRDVVTKIVGSKNYLDGGMIAITFDNAPQGLPDADVRGCCGQPGFVNLTNPPLPVAPTDPTGPTSGVGSTAPVGAATLKSGAGGKVGLLLISPLIAEGTVNSTDEANHFSMLLSIENWFATEKLGLTASPTVAPLPDSIFKKAPAGG